VLCPFGNMEGAELGRTRANGIGNVRVRFPNQKIARADFQKQA